MSRCTDTSTCCFLFEKIDFGSAYYTKDGGLVPNITICWAIRERRIPFAKLHNATITYFNPTTTKRFFGGIRLGGIAKVNPIHVLATEDLAFYFAYEDLEPIYLEPASTPYPPDDTDNLLLTEDLDFYIVYEDGFGIELEIEDIFTPDDTDNLLLTEDSAFYLTYEDEIAIEYALSPP